MMDEGVLGVDEDTKRRQPAHLDEEELAAGIRRPAADAHRTLSRPEATTGELVELRRRLRGLLCAARGWHLTEIERWLRSAERTLDAQLVSGLVVERERAVG